MAAAALGHALPDDSVWVSSPELKAVETLRCARQAADVEIREDDRLGEVFRPDEPFDERFAERRRAWVEGRIDERHIGWEPREDAASRFDAAVRAREGSPSLVVGTHGLVLTAWLVSIGQVEPGSPAGAFWARLAFPDLIRVSYS